VLATNEDVIAVVEIDADVALVTVPSTLAAATYEADVAKPVNDPVKDPLNPEFVFNDPDILNDPEKTVVSDVTPVNTSYTSDIKLADINPPEVICARFVDNTPIIFLFFYKYNLISNLLPFHANYH
jgi:hypothetical protein